MVLTAASTPSLGTHSVQPVSDLLRVAFVQPHPMSKAKVIFLAILVVFFCVLFMASYIWMRRPDFGQGGKPVPRTVENQPVSGPKEDEGPTVGEQEASREGVPSTA